LASRFLRLPIPEPVLVEHAELYATDPPESWRATA
jgi:hypothetical protein